MENVLQRNTNVTPHTVQLAATIEGSNVVVSGNGGANLPANSGAHRFDFSLTSPPGVSVRFASLDTQDNCSTCPPASGENSQQIVAVHIGPNGDTAGFTDNNSNRQAMDVSYQWNFTCSDPSLQVQPFDPIIRNGGTTGITTTTPDF
jgi:hypothetical protein